MKLVVSIFLSLSVSIAHAMEVPSLACQGAANGVELTFNSDKKTLPGIEVVLKKGGAEVALLGIMVDAAGGSASYQLEGDNSLQYDYSEGTVALDFTRLSPGLRNLGINSQILLEFPVTCTETVEEVDEESPELEKQVAKFYERLAAASKIYEE
jgi:hypothetical protein